MTMPAAKMIGFLNVIKVSTNTQCSYKFAIITLQTVKTTRATIRFKVETLSWDIDIERPQRKSD
jgi:hypothetical protein